jgi:hypothetical protein
MDGVEPQSHAVLLWFGVVWVWRCGGIGCGVVLWRCGVSFCCGDVCSIGFALSAPKQWGGKGEALTCDFNTHIEIEK